MHQSSRGSRASIQRTSRPVSGGTTNAHAANGQCRVHHGFIRSARHNTARMYAERMAAVQSEHQAIFAAIDGGDPDAAGRAAEQHLRNAADRLRLFQAERPAPV